MILRPKVSHYIEQWRERYFPQHDTIRAQFQLDPELKATVQKIDQVLSFLKIPSTSNLVDVADLIVGLRDAMGSYPQKSQESKPEGESEEQGQKAEPPALAASENQSGILSEILPEERPLSEVSLREFTEQLQQMEISSKNESPKGHENSQSFNAQGMPYPRIFIKSLCS
jgi:hypothetical protein